MHGERSRTSLSDARGDLDAGLAERTLELCRIASPIGQEREIADHLERWAQSVYPRAQVYRQSHSLAIGSLADPRPTVALVGHVDTVPIHPGDGPVRMERDRIFGRGSSDMKG